MEKVSMTVFPSLLAGGVIEGWRERRRDSRRIRECETADLSSVGFEVVRGQAGETQRNFQRAGMKVRVNSAPWSIIK